MTNKRRDFVKKILTLGALMPIAKWTNAKAAKPTPLIGSKPAYLIVSTWDAGMRANVAAKKILEKNGAAIDAVEAGVKVTELEKGCCVGLNGRPDRDGFVTLDACIMNHKHECGGVAALQHIKHPISVARAVMEKTPHVLLVGDGAYQFARKQGHPHDKRGLEADSKKAYEKWLKQNKYKPEMNIERGKDNHDTIGMLAIDKGEDISGSCTTSGMAFKMHGRVGDSPIIGAGLFVDNKVGAATGSGLGEEVIRIAGAALIVELMRNGNHPKEACRLAIERIVQNSPKDLSEVQVGFIAIDKLGRYGAYALQKGFNYSVCTDTYSKLYDSEYYFG